MGSLNLLNLLKIASSDYFLNIHRALKPNKRIFPILINWMSQSLILGLLGDIFQFHSTLISKLKTLIRNCIKQLLIWVF